MIGTGYYQQPTMRPGGLALVIAMHAAVFAGLVLVKTTIDRSELPITEVFNVLVPTPEPDPVPPEPTRERVAEEPIRFQAPPSPFPLPTDGPVAETTDRPPPPLESNPGERVELAGIPDLPDPVRVEAQIEPRNLQPPYPPGEEAAQREGRVQVRVTIGADGRVKAVERVSATSDAFWRVTERHALARWRFRPATIDGRPIESRKVITLTFRLDG